ncbi:MAG: CAP domain-containing protein [Patescibacteria group bacterium]|nr:CAP domain-containing protein [Patescibacteria group bacterium]
MTVGVFESKDRMTGLMQSKIKQGIVEKATVMLMFFGVFVICGAHFAVANEELNDTLINTSNVIEFVNKERVDVGIEPLTENELLNTVAQKKLDNMMEENYFAHTSPNGTDPWEWFLQSGYDFAYAGENLATEFNDVYKQHQGWMNSPKHKQNILDERFIYTGVAVGQREVDGENVTLTVQVFATPPSVSITSPNFTPETFEVPDALFYKGIKDVNAQPQDYVEDDPLFVKAGTTKYNDASQSPKKESQVKTFAWIFIGLLVIVIFWLEYHIFATKGKK